MNAATYSFEKMDARAAGLKVIHREAKDVVWLN
jgi:hypothetical protein